MSLADLIGVMSNGVVAIAAAAGAWAAVRGVSTWREQLVWQADNEIATKVIADVYNYRDAVFRFRRANLNEQEHATFETRGGGENLGFDDLMDRMEPIFTARLETVISASSKLQATLEEARFHWGGELPKEFHEIFELQLEISNFLKTYYGAIPRMEPRLRELIYGQLKDTLAILSDSVEEQDLRKEEFIERVEVIERFLRGKMGRPK